MTAEFSLALAVTIVVILILRLVLPQLPLRRLAVRLTVIDSALLVVGVAGLAFHCLAMFSRQIFEPLPAVRPLVALVNSPGIPTIVLFAVPALLVLVALRRQQRLAGAIIALALLAVGMTMYVVGSLQVHLVTIFASAVLLAAVVAFLTIAPWRRAATRPA